MNEKSEGTPVRSYGAPAEMWQGLMAAKEITKVVNISRSHWLALVKEGKAPPPAIRDGGRFTRWRARDVQDWLSDPSGWPPANAGKGVAA